MRSLHVQAGPEIVPADETAVLAEFFSHTGGRKRGRCRAATLPSLIKDHRDWANKVATLALEVVEERLPQWDATNADGTIVFGRKLKRSQARRVVVVPRHLLTINWMDTVECGGDGLPIPGAP